jgi:ABC-type amino acid transport substrate-binding protein
VRDRRMGWLAATMTALALVAAACNTGGDAGDDPTPTATGGDEPAFSTVQEGVFTVGSDIPYPPFEFREGGELKGLDIDLIREIGSRLGFEGDAVEIVDTDFDTIFAQLAQGRYDVVVAASTITPEREETVNFSDPYYAAQQSLTVNTNERDDIASTDDLGEGDVVAVQSGTTGEQWARDNLEAQGVEIRAFPEGPDGYSALEQGQVDGVLNDEPTALAEVANRPGLEVVQTIDTGEFYGIAVDPNNEPLLEAVNEALAEIIEDGTYDEIYGRYPDLPPGGNIAQAQ